VCIGTEPLEPLAHRAAECDNSFDRIDTERLKEVRVFTHEIAANWKIVLENFSECDHCIGAYPELSQVIQPMGQIRRPDAGTDVDWQFGSFEYSEVSQSLRPGFQSLTADGSYACNGSSGNPGASRRRPSARGCSSAFSESAPVLRRQRQRLGDTSGLDR
jgi:phenylpropionate dioxygenase-like ring-hydroxylating dioxygenase large terminal subunit